MEEPSYKLSYYIEQCILIIIKFCKGFPLCHHVSVIQRCPAVFSQPVCDVAQNIFQSHETQTLALVHWELRCSELQRPLVRVFRTTLLQGEDDWSQAVEKLQPILTK